MPRDKERWEILSDDASMGVSSSSSCFKDVCDIPSSSQMKKESAQICLSTLTSINLSTLTHIPIPAWMNDNEWGGGVKVVSLVPPSLSLSLSACLSLCPFLHCHVPLQWTAGCTHPTTNGGTQDESSGGIYTHCIHIFARLGVDLHAQSVLINNFLPSEISRKFIKSAMLVGHDLKEKEKRILQSPPLHFEELQIIIFFYIRELTK